MEETLEARICRIEDKQAILDCLMAYTRDMDRADRDLLMSAYHPDAIDPSRIGRVWSGYAQSKPE